MSDFLTRLAARGFDTAQVIRPRLASLFEPLTPEREVLVGPDIVSRGVSRSDWRSADREPNDGVDSRIIPRGDAAHEPVRESFARVRDMAGKALDTDQPVPGLARNPALRPQDLAPRTVIGDRPVHNQAEQGAEQPDAIHSSRAESHRVTPLRAVRSLSLGIEDRLAVAAKDPEKDPSRRTADAVDPGTVSGRGRLRQNIPTGPMAEAERALTPVQDEAIALPKNGPDYRVLANALIGARYAAPRVEPARRTPREGRPDPEPTIQVTIGRIEVRAVTEEARPRRERHTAPVMTLEEYLRRRANGGRR